MDLSVIIGIVGLLGWGAICSIYVIRDGNVSLVMVLPLFVFMVMIGMGLK